MTKNRSLLLVLAGSVCVLCVALYLAFAAPSQAPAESGGAVAPRSEPRQQPIRPAARASWERSWQLGLQYVHTLDLDQTLWLEPAEQNPRAEDATMHITLKGELTETVVDALATEYYVQWVLNPAELTLQAKRGAALDSSARDAMLVALRKPFYVMFSSRGGALDTYFAPDTDPGSQALLRTLVGSLQVVLPPASQQHWRSNELDTTGSYEASYRQVGRQRAYEKARVQYLRVATPDGLSPIARGVQIEPRGSTQLVLDDALWVESLTAHERIAVRAPPSPLAIAELKLAYRLLEQRDDPARIGSFQSNRARLSPKGLAVSTLAPEPEQDRLRRIVNGATLDSLLSELGALPSGQQVRGPATSKIMHKLIALFQLEPERALEVPKLIGAQAERNVYSSLIGSLSAATNPESVAALTQISADASLPRAMRVDAIAALGAAQKPDAAGLEQLRQLARSQDGELRNTATLALGSTARNLRANGDQAADGAFQHLLQQAASARDPEERALQLSALANTASPDALQPIAAALASDSVQVREAAVTALRTIPDDRADQMLAAQVLNDPSPDVRRRALFACSFRPLAPLMPALTELLSTEQTDAVRMDAVRLIGENRNQVSGALALLSAASRADPNPDIRHAAAAFLSASQAL